MFERLTVTAGMTLFFARQETTELGGMTIEPEHLLLGLLRADKGPTPRLFGLAKLSYGDARAEIRSHWGVRPHVATSVELPFADQTERILQYATEEADRAAHTHIGTGHLLLGLLRENGSFAAAMLKGHGMAIDDLRDHIMQPPAVAEPEPETPGDGNVVVVTGLSFDAVVSVERIRVLAEEIARSQNDGMDTRSLIDEIHYHLDALKQHVART
jgi:ATP-dependent Clp protease ATP-binding subunit ClpC